MKMPQYTSKHYSRVEKTRTMALATIALAAVMIVVSLVLGKFILEEIGYNNKVLGAQREAISTLENNASAADELAASYTIFETANGGISPDEVLDALPGEYDFNAVNTSLQYLIDQGGLQTESIRGEDQELTAENSQYEPTPVEIPFTVEAVGRYDRAREFFNILNRSTRPLVVTRVELTGTDEELIVNIGGTTFYQPKASLEYPTRSIE